MCQATYPGVRLFLSAAVMTTYYPAAAVRMCSRGLQVGNGAI